MTIQLIAEELYPSKVCLKGVVTRRWLGMPPRERRGKSANVGEKKKQESDVKRV